MKKDITQVMAAADRMLPELENPRHLAIIANYRAHALLEIAGRWREIWTRGLIVDHPHYRLSQYGRFTTYDGRDEVMNFYAQADQLGVVTMFEDEEIAVADWGFFSQFTEFEYIPGVVAAEMLSDVVDCDFSDPGATYLFSCRVEMSWDYDQDARLKREKGHQDIGTFACGRVDPGDAITRAEASRALAPLISSATSYLEGACVTRTRMATTLGAGTAQAPRMNP